MNPWGRSACYPRRTFYPMSDGPSIRDHRITKSYFRTCSRCLSYSQAPLCLCTQRLVSNQSEGTFERLRYSLGGDRPSQTTHQTRSLHQIHGARLDIQFIQGGISLMPPLYPEAEFHRLPPILRVQHQNSVLSYSKGARGLSVP